jgi:hypothetical protein
MSYGSSSSNQIRFVSRWIEFLHLGFFLFNSVIFLHKQVDGEKGHTETSEQLTETHSRKN